MFPFLVALVAPFTAASVGRALKYFYCRRQKLFQLSNSLTTALLGTFVKNSFIKIDMPRVFSCLKNPITCAGRTGSATTLVRPPIALLQSRASTAGQRGWTVPSSFSTLAAVAKRTDTAGVGPAHRLCPSCGGDFRNVSTLPAAQNHLLLQLETRGLAGTPLRPEGGEGGARCDSWVFLRYDASERSTYSRPSGLGNVSKVVNDT